MTALRAVSTESGWREQLRALAAPVLLDGVDIEIAADDPVFGGPSCAIEECVRIIHQHGLCEMHYHRWNAAARPAIQTWESGPPVTHPDRLKLASVPETLRHELAYSDPARVAGRRTPVERPGTENGHLQAPGAGNQLPARPRRNPLAPPRWLIQHTAPRVLDVHDRPAGTLAGISGREAEFTRDRWRLRRLHHIADDGVTDWIYRFDEIPTPGCARRPNTSSGGGWTPGTARAG